MAQGRARRRLKGDASNGALATITQAQYMIRIYAEILAMDEKIMERIRQLVAKEPDNGERDAYLTNMRLVLSQLEKVGKRIVYWNARVSTMVKRQLPR